jgi:hypothetical protein
MTRWNITGTMTWFLLFFIVLSYEIWAGINHGQHIPMLTQVVVRYIPWPFTLGFIVWLFAHFAVRYRNRTYKQWLAEGGAGAEAKKKS